MKDADPQIRMQAIRASETLYKAGDKSFAADYKALTRDAGRRTSSCRRMMTLNTLKVAERPTAIKATRWTRTRRKGVQLVASTILNPEMPPRRRTRVAGSGGGPPPRRRRRRSSRVAGSREDDLRRSVLLVPRRGRPG